MIEWINYILYFSSTNLSHFQRTVVTILRKESTTDSCDNFEERKHNRAYFVHFPIQTNIFGMTNKNNLVQKCKKSQNRKHISESYRRLF